MNARRISLVRRAPVFLELAAAAVVVVVALVVFQLAAGDGGAGVMTDAEEPSAGRAAAGGSLRESTGWVRLDDPPISGRVGASLASTEGRLYVLGGWAFTCPPGADCVSPSEPPFEDGAVFDLATGEWDRIADAPVGFRNAPAAVIGDDVYVLSQCDPDPTCPADRSLLRYRSAEDEWDRLPPPTDTGYFDLVPFAGDLVAFSGTDEAGADPDFRFDVDREEWTPLPDDPLPPVYDRQAVDHDGRLLLFGTPIDGPSTKLGAALDPANGTWTELPASGTLGFQVWRSGDRLYLNPHFGSSAGGGVFDLATSRWSPLPAPPPSENWSNDIAGVLGAASADYEYSAGWVLDATDETWIEVPTRPVADMTFDESVGSIGTSLVVFGGQRWMDGDGDLLAETWRWIP